MIQCLLLPPTDNLSAVCYSRSVPRRGTRVLIGGVFLALALYPQQPAQRSVAPPTPSPTAHRPESPLPVLHTERVIPQPTPRPVSIRYGRPEIGKIIRDAAAKYGIDTNRFLRIAWCESRLNPRAFNRRGCEGYGCLGLFQQHRKYWPARARRAGFAGASAFDPRANASVSAWMIRWGGGWRHWTCR